MKKIFLIGIVVCLLALLNGANAATSKKKKPKTKHKIEFVTKDKHILAGDLYIANPSTNKPLVVMLHSFSLNALSWQPIAQQLRLKGYNVLAMDLRGHSRSVYNEKLKIKSRFKYTNSDWQKLPEDVIESIAYVKSNYPKINTNDTIFVGADIGASAGIIAGASMKKKPEKFVIISPMLNFKGLYIPIKIASYTDTKFLVILSKSDKILFNFYSSTKPLIITYPKGGPGNQLLKVNPQSTNDIVNFVTN